MSEGGTIANLRRLSLNQITTEQWSVEQAVRGCKRAGIPFIGLWRHKVAEIGAARAAALVEDAGLEVSSLCRGGMFPAGTSAERRARIDDNRRAIDEASIVGTDLLVLVCGPPFDRDISSARGMVRDGIGELVPYAHAAGVRLAIEPLHPMYVADRSVIVTLAEAVDLANCFDIADVGVVVDAYHVWWDPALYDNVGRAGKRIFGFHLCDWVVPLSDHLWGRGMMGDGFIDLRRIRTAVEAAGYSGPMEVEILNRDLLDMPGEAVLSTIKARYLSCV